MELENVFVFCAVAVATLNILCTGYICARALVFEVFGI